MVEDWHGEIQTLVGQVRRLHTSSITTMQCTLIRTRVPRRRSDRYI